MTCHQVTSFIMPTKKADVFIMVDSGKKANGENNLKKVGELTCEGESLSWINSGGTFSGVASPHPVESVQRINQKIMTAISKRAFSAVTQDHIHLTHEDISVHIIHEMGWRRCRGYLAIQTSARGTRYLLYLVDHVYHSAMSFGTSVEIVGYDQVKKAFVEEVKRIRDNWEQYRHAFADLSDDDFDMDTYDQRFGIAN